MYTKPYFVFLCGPTGAGKSRLLQTVCDLLGDKNPTDFVRLSIDDRVEEFFGYREGISSICEDMKSKELENTLTNSTLIKNFNNNYYSSKQELSRELDEELKKQMRKSSNICWEVTGTKELAWMFDDELIRDYEIVLAYTFVEYNELRKRNRFRFSEDMTRFCNFFSGSPPRLTTGSVLTKAEAEAETLRRTQSGGVEQPIEELLKNYRKGILEDIPKKFNEFRKKIKDFRLIVVDNTPEKSEVKNDQDIGEKTEIDFKTIVENIVFPGGGKIRNKRNKSKKKKSKKKKSKKKKKN